MVLEKTPESPLDCKEISLEYSLEGLMLRLKLPIFWLPDVNRQLIGKVPDAGKDRWQETRAPEDDMAERHH